MKRLLKKMWWSKKNFFRSSVATFLVYLGRCFCGHKYRLWYNYYGPPNKRYDESYRVRNNKSMWFCTKCQKTKVEDYAFYG